MTRKPLVTSVHVRSVRGARNFNHPTFFSSYYRTSLVSRRSLKHQHSNARSIITKYSNTGTLNTWLNEKRGSSGNFIAVDSLEKAWTEYANKGHLVWFHDSGHIATAIPTTELIERGGHKVGEIVQAGASVGRMYLNYAWSSSSFGKIIATAYMKEGW